VSFSGDVLEGSRVGEARDQAKPRFSYSRPHAVDKGELQQRRVDRPLGDELLHLIQERGALLVVELDSLLLVERVDFGVVAVGVGPALDDERR